MKTNDIERAGASAAMILAERIVGGGPAASLDEAMALDAACSTDELTEAADMIRSQCCGNRLDTCSIINARSGRCSEDCKWCAQSRHFATGVREYEIVDEEEALRQARDCASRGVMRYSLVTSGRRVTSEQIESFCRIFRRIASEVPGLKLCASMGLIGPKEMNALADAGVTRYHCNLETSSDFFPELCSSHTHEDKLKTIAAAAAAGMQVCSGGIIGMGETLRQRLQLVKEAHEAGAVSVPVNILNPIPGTPLENAAPLSDDEIIRSVALMRFVAPQAVMRFAGGRSRLSEATTERILRGGMNGVMVGDLLTTVGNSVDDDYRMFGRTGYDL